MWSYYQRGDEYVEVVIDDSHFVCLAEKVVDVLEFHVQNYSRLSRLLDLFEQRPLVVRIWKWAGADMGRT